VALRRWAKRNSPWPTRVKCNATSLRSLTVRERRRWLKLVRAERKNSYITEPRVMDITTLLLQGSPSKLDTSVIPLLQNLRLDIGPAKIYGVERVVTPRVVLKVKEVSTKH